MKRILTGPAVVAAVLVATPAQATFPGGNGRIAYQDAHADVPQISSVDPNGSGLAQLTSGPRANQYPAWSADGSDIVYVRSRGVEAGRHVIMTMNANGSGKTSIFRARPGRKEILGPAWSPDGTQIVFCAEGRRPPVLFVVGADGSGLTKVTRGQHFDCHPSWSPDGNSIAFATLSGRHIAIATMDADGSNRTVLVRRGFNDEPDWSPDGSQVIFFKIRGDARSDIFTIGADGAGRTQITDTPGRWEWSPTFSPNGARIAFARGQTRRVGSAGDIFTVAADGSDEERVTDTTGIDEFWLTWQPT